MDYLPGEDHTIERPASYSEWQNYVPKLTPSWTGRLFSWTMCDPKTLGPRQAFFDPEPKEPGRAGLNLWMYRRIADCANFAPGAYKSSITLVNWPQNNFWLGDLVTAAPAHRPRLLERAKQLSLSFMYWTKPKLDGRDCGSAKTLSTQKTVWPKRPTFANPGGSRPSSRFSRNTSARKCTMLR